MEKIHDSVLNYLSVIPDSDLVITALFKEDKSSAKIVINEINYNLADLDTEDWIELYNAGDSDTDLSAWIFKDENDAHSFIIPENTIIGRNGYLVICRDKEKFKYFYPEINNYGNFTFGLDNAGEHIRLLDKNKNLVDSLTYDDRLPWPVESDGSGKTLELINPNLDNLNPLNWSDSKSNGSPGKQNTVSCFSHS